MICVIPPTPRQREIEQSFVCKKVEKIPKKLFLKGDVIKKALLEKDSSLYELAKRLDVNKNSMYNMAQGIKSIDTKLVN